MTIPKISVSTPSLGTSLALVDGDLALTAGDDRAHDLALVSGVDNMAQALRVIVETPFGSDQVNVNYGLDVAAIFTFASTVASVKDVIRLNLVKSLSVDDRVTEIIDVAFDDDSASEQAATAAGADPGRTARRTRAWHAMVTLATTAGSSHSIALAAGAP